MVRHITGIDYPFLVIHSTEEAIIVHLTVDWRKTIIDEIEKYKQEKIYFFKNSLKVLESKPELMLMDKLPREMDPEILIENVFENIT
jgi:hypothetical protein